MKKLITVIVLGALLLAAVPLAGFAAGHGWSSGLSGRGVCAGSGAPCATYVDANGDGVCDNRGTSGANYVDANGDGVCDNRGTNGAGYVDVNGDGVCDNRGCGWWHAGGGQQRGHHGCRG